MSDNLIEKNGQWFDENGTRVWRAGTLVYYKRDLIKMFFWLYIGQFTFWMQVSAFPVLLPLLFKHQGFSTAQTGMLLSTLPLGALIIFPNLRSLPATGAMKPWIISAASGRGISNTSKIICPTAPICSPVTIKTISLGC